MAGVEQIPLRIPETWDPAWFHGFIRDVLSRLDPRNGIGNGVAISSTGNSVVTLDIMGTIEDAIDEHEEATDPHPDLIDDLPAASSVAEADLLVVSQSGTNRQATVDQVGDAVFGDDWTDLVIAATGINPPGAASDPARNTTTGLLEFSASADNVITGCWQMPHGWSGHFDSSKAVVVPHMHVRFLTSTSAPTNVSRWKFEYDMASINGDFASAYGSLTTLATVSVTNPANTAKAALVSFGDLDAAGIGASGLIHFKISRLANSDGADTDTSVVALYSMDLHYQQRRAGSEESIPT